MIKMKNQVHIEGRLYEHKLERKVSGATSKNPGTPFISGSIDIATDDENLNIVSIHYTYVTATTSKGRPNTTYAILDDIIENNKSVVAVGADEAVRLRAETSIGLNEFYSDRNGESTFVSNKRNEGGFLFYMSDPFNENIEQRSRFVTSMLITKIREVEADAERNLPAKVMVSGYIFDFRNALLPVEYTARAEKAMDYFLSLTDVNENHPFFTNIVGQEISQVISRTIVEEGAFSTEVRIVPSTTRMFEILLCDKEPIGSDWEEAISAAELKEALQNREILKADIKTRQEEYQATKAKATPVAAVKGGSYQF